MNWTEMKQPAFDRSLRKQAEFNATAQDGMFPDLEAPAVRNKGVTAPLPMPGEQPLPLLFGTDGE